MHSYVFLLVNLLTFEIKHEPTLQLIAVYLHANFIFTDVITTVYSDHYMSSSVKYTRKIMWGFTDTQYACSCYHFSAIVSLLSLFKQNKCRLIILSVCASTPKLCNALITLYETWCVYYATCPHFSSVRHTYISPHQ
jgi:hypothetical protein